MPLSGYCKGNPKQSGSCLRISVGDALHFAEHVHHPSRPMGSLNQLWPTLFSHCLYGFHLPTSHVLESFLASHVKTPKEVSLKPISNWPLPSNLDLGTCNVCLRKRPALAPPTDLTRGTGTYWLAFKEPKRPPRWRGTKPSLWQYIGTQSLATSIFKLCQVPGVAKRISPGIWVALLHGGAAQEMLVVGLAA